MNRILFLIYKVIIYMINRITTAVLITAAASLMVLGTDACNIEGCSQCKAGDPEWWETCADGFGQNPDRSKECRSCYAGCKTCVYQANTEFY